MPEGSELVLWEEPIERVYAEEIPNEEPYYYEKKSGGNSNLALYIFIGVVIGAGLIQIVKDNSERRARDEDRKRKSKES